MHPMCGAFAVFAHALSVATASVWRVDVTRNPDGSYDPPYDEAWPPRLQLQWTAGVTATVTGLRIHVSDLEDDRYGVHVGGSGFTPMDLGSAYSFLYGVRIGAKEARQ